MGGVLRSHEQRKLENICNGVKMKREFIQNLLYAAEAAQCN